MHRNRNDSFDIIKYNIRLNLSNFKVSKAISGHCELEIAKKLDAKILELDLLALIVDSISMGNSTLPFIIFGEKIKITLPQEANDTVVIKVYYHGKPVKDKQWGGFYFNGDYAYNMGVGFEANPHNFGRVWFPCFDDFTDRALYDFSITVDAGMKAYCNGLLTSIDTLKNFHTFHWSMKQSIPTYLASIAVAPYEEINYISSDIPVTLVAKKEDTANMRASFVHLPQAIEAFITAYGPHNFDRIGFNIVPFDAGAMEHATNIAYPKYAIQNGSLANETLFAHELAHHWWGNTTTTASAEEMWLNEGWASYSEALFIEYVYGKEAYYDYVKALKRRVLQFTHINDGEVLPVRHVGHEHTYSSTVYKKGALMIHTLREMMGDELFFNACKDFMATYKFQNVNSENLSKVFAKHSKINMENFFNAWLNYPGFNHVDIVASSYKNRNHYLTLAQRPRFIDKKPFRQMIPSAFVVYNPEKNIIISDTSALPIEQVSFTQTIELATENFLLVIDPTGTLGFATTAAQDTFTVLKPVDFSYALMDVTIEKTPKNKLNLLRIEHHWTNPPSEFANNPKGCSVSKERYWHVRGFIDPEVNMSGKITYNGQKITSKETGYLDADLIRITEDSLVLLYRKDWEQPWEIVSDAKKEMGSLFDKFGTITIPNLKVGQYALGMFDHILLGAEDLKKEEKPSLSVFPNPAENSLTIEFPEPQKGGIVEITNGLGQIVLTKTIVKNTRKMEISTSEFPYGIYYIGVLKNGVAYDVVPFRKR